MIKPSTFIFFVFVALFGPVSLAAGIRADGKTSTINLKTNASTLKLKDQISGFSGRLQVFDDSASRITADIAEHDLITFSDGLFNAGSGDIVITGTLPAGTADITLGTGSTFNTSGASVARGITIGAGQTSVLTGFPELSADTTLADAAAQLNVDLVSKLSQNIVLGGGTVRLDNDLAFIDGKTFTGSGTVDVNNRTLTRAGGVTNTGTITYLNADDVVFTGNQTLDGGTESFSGSGLTSLVNGNGYTWTLTNGGKIEVLANHTLYLTDIFIKGLGPTGTDGYFDIDSTAEIILSGVTLDLAGNYAHSDGQLTISGDNCKLIHHDNTFDVSGGSTILRVDGVAFEYEPLDGSQSEPFTYTDKSSQLVLANGGIIRRTTEGSDTDLIIDTTPFTLTRNHRLTEGSKIKFTNATPGTPKPMVFDGGGYTIDFPDNNISDLIEIETNVQLSVKEVTMKGFQPGMVTYGAASSTLTFAEDAHIILGGDLTIDESTSPIVFDVPTGEAGIISGNGHTLTLSGTPDRLTMDGDGSLLLRDMVLSNKKLNAFNVLSNTSTTFMQDMDLTLNDENFTFDAGSLYILGRTRFIGANQVAAFGASGFDFASTGDLLIFGQSSLEIMPDTFFRYFADASGDTGDTGAAKRHMRLVDPSSELILNSCTFTTTASGMALDYGKVIVKNKVDFNISTSAAAQFELGTAVDLQIMGAGILSIDGPVEYVTTTFP